SSIGETVYDWDLATDRLIWGPNVCDVLGIADASHVATGFAYAEHLAAESASSRFEAVVKSSQSDEGCGVPYQVRYALAMARDGDRARNIWIEDTGRWFAAHNGMPGRAHGVVRVITDRHETERHGQASRIDALTGTMSRNQAVEHLTRMFARTQHRPAASFSVLLAAIGNLHRTNHNFGYDVGDELIVGVGRRLAGQMRSTDALARYSGHKFLLILDNCDAEQMELAARRFIKTIAEADFATAVGPLPAALQIGGVTAPRQARTPQVLFQRAEEALEAAHARRPVRFVAYEPSLQRDNAKIHDGTVAAQIVGALNQRRIEIALEPIVDARSRVPFFYEALLRMRLDDGSFVAPSAILPVAEKIGLVQLLDHRVLELALGRLAEEPSLNLSINMSAASIHEPDWPTRAHAAFALNAGVAKRLTIEITETCAIEDIEATRQAIAAMKQLGVKVAMDDFGAGHTSFRNLRELAFDLLKIDGAFVQNLARSADDRFFVRTLVDLARHLNIPVVAEWVEDAETADLLAGWGVDYFQGSLFGRAETDDRRSRAVAA
ncbi:MAG TPA: bifunctional diguanylate cyclase/phosphodiesterase, partial [Beijerinckiaceae bacterium]|nr:bifunctional diguanylate cyclase/phosphodiesterase [Beijerinckiaceae bacterium]